ncbi:MAG TPA: glucose-1-phosphate adenylyltransferase [Steroidobacteraceae bacterium]|nr:glucose-1-phosphate adenylyltransferase [Steroidobacteraceae bacterium]
MNSNVPTPHQQAPDTLAIVLAGGNGTRLGELTRWQCKPAIPFAGHFRNIDFTLSNCINSGLRRVAVLTQYKAQTLISHLTGGWSFLPRALGEFVEIWPAQQRLHSSWYAGTADAVHQNLDMVLAQRTRYTLVLAGDHIYKMDYRPLIEQHAHSGADVTLACVPVPLEEAASFGVLGVEGGQRVRSFIEKPQPASLRATNQRTVLASMGVYVFCTDYLADRLRRDANNPDSAHDFGRNILPCAVREDHVGAYSFTDAKGGAAYWRDVGTLDAYWQAHMELLVAAPPIELFDPAWPIFTSAEQLPPARVMADAMSEACVIDSLLGGGVIVRGARVSRSVLAANVQVGAGSTIAEAVILPNARIGANCRLQRVIVDAGMQIPDGTVAGVAPTAELQSPRSGGVTLLVQEPAESAHPDDGLRSVA